VEQLLADCGAGPATLSADQRAALDADGYLLLRGVVERAWLGELRAALEAALASPPPDAEVAHKTGTRHADGLPWKGEAFDGVWTHPAALAAAYHVLGRPFQLLFLGGRDPRPGFGQQALHGDWLPRVPGEPFHALTAIWMLDDFTVANGATRLVPGSHRIPRPLPMAMRDPAARHPEQRVVEAEAGSVLVFNAHLWHSGRQNRSEGPRRALQCQYVGRDVARPGAPPPGEPPARWSPAARALLGLAR